MDTRDVLDAYVFEDLSQVRMLTEEWMDDYNFSRPHDGLPGRSPMDMLAVDLWKTSKRVSHKPTADNNNNDL